MREIKFRVYLDASEYDESLPYIEKSRMLSWEDLKDHTDPLQEYFDNGILGCSKPMQYIGLKDKNGVEIYEGDVIEAKIIFENKSLSTMGVIEYDEQHASFANKNDAGLTLMHNIYKSTIIGNIYENPELIKK